MTVPNKKILHYLKSILLGFVLLIIGVVGLSYWLLSSDNERIPALICHIAKEKLGIEMAFSRLRTDKTSNFPYLTLEMEDVYIQGSHYDTYGKELLRVNKLSMLLPPWELLGNNYKIQNIIVDTAHIFFYKDALGGGNTEFLKRLAKPKSPQQAQTNESKEKAPKGKISMKKISFNHVHFDIENDLKDQAFNINFEQATINLNDKAGMPNIVLDAACFFEGLYFKKSKGGFLVDKAAQLKLDIDMMPTKIQLNPSALTVEGDELKLGGYFTKADTNYLHLTIQSEGILLESVRSLLSPAIQKALSLFYIDQPLTADFELVGPLIPGHPPAMHIDFGTKNTNLKFKEINFSQLNLAGNFSNDCFVTDRIRPNSSCLTIHQLEGKLLGKFPTKLTGRINDLQQLSDVQAVGTLDLPLADLNDLLGEQSGINLVEGAANLQFDYRGAPKALVKKDFRNQKRIKATIKFEDSRMNLMDNTLPIEIPTGQIMVDKSKVTLANLALKMPGVTGTINGKINNVLPFLTGNRQRLATGLTLDFKKIQLDQLLEKIGKKTPKTASINSAKKDTLLGNQLAEIITQITNIVVADIQLNIRNFDFKDINAQNIGVIINAKTDCEEEEGESPCLQLSNLQATILKDIEVKGNIAIANLTDPKLDMDIALIAPAKTMSNYLKKEALTISSGEIELDAIANLYLNDFQQFDKLLERIIFNSTLQTRNLAATYNQLTIKDLNSNIHLNQDTLLIDKLNLSYKDITPEISGRITNFLPLAFGKEQAANIDLHIAIPTLNLEKNLSDTIATKPKSATDSLFSPRTFIASLEDIYKIADGKIALSIQDLLVPHYPTKNVSLVVNIDKSCDAEKEGIHCIGIEQFHADIFGDIPVDGEIRIKDLKAPTLSLTLAAAMPMHDLNRVLYNDNFIAKEGEVDLTINYEIPVSDELTAKHYILNSTLKGAIEFKNVDIAYPARDFQIAALNGLIRFNQKSLDIDTLSLKLNNNWVYANGHAPDFLPYFFQEDKHFHVNVAVNSPSFDIATFSTPKTVQEKAKPTTEELTAKLNAIDKLLTAGTIEFTTNIAELKYKDFVASQLFGKIHIGADKVALNRLTMQVASGEFGIHGTITNILEHHPSLAVETYFNDANIHEVFIGFQNFGQKEITHANIKGKLSADIQFKADLDDDYSVKPKSIDSKINLKVSEGELIDFPPLKNMTSFLFKNRELDDIYFDTLNTKLQVSGLDLKIDHFQIHSSAATLNIDGLYTFGEKDKTRIFFEVPLSNLFKPHIDPELIKTHHSKRSGLPILIEAKEEGKKLKFKLKLFKRKHEK